MITVPENHDRYKVKKGGGDVPGNTSTKDEYLKSCSVGLIPGKVIINKVCVCVY